MAPSNDSRIFDKNEDTPKYIHISQLDIFQVVADPSRRQMLYLLSKESLSINSLAGNFDMSRPAVSKHVKILEHAGFVSIEDKGRERYCTLKKDGFSQLKKWITYFDIFWTDKLDKLEILLNQKDKLEP